MVVVVNKETNRERCNAAYGGGIGIKAELGEELRLLPQLPFQALDLLVPVGQRGLELVAQLRCVVFEGGHLLR